jgi:hypothetical protein
VCKEKGFSIEHWLPGGHRNSGPDHVALARRDRVLLDS